MEDQINKTEEEGVLQRLRESPRTVSALIIILIVAAAIYAFSDQGGEPQEALTPSDESIAVETEEGEEVIPTQAAAETVSPEIPAGSDSSIASPAPSRTAQGFVEVAQSGEGVTHLARRAAAQWLQENQVDYEVSKAHLIYIEDYIKDQVGSKSLTIGQEQLITFDLVAEAVGNAKQLTPAQLDNLQHYTQVLP